MRAILALTFLLLGASFPLSAQFDFGCTNPSACNYNQPSGPTSEDMHYFILGSGDSALISDGDLLHWGAKEVNVSAGDLFGFSVKSDGGANHATLVITNLVHNSIPCVPGCVYEEALNFDSTATMDDGSCVYPDATCPSDLNGD